MKILMISSNYPPLLGGPASSVPSLSKYLAKKGFEVYVLTQGCHGYPSFYEENKFFVHRCPIIKGNFYHPHVILRKISLMSRLGSKLIKKHNIDLIHSHDLNISGLVGYTANRKERKPNICKFGGDLAWEYISLIKWKEKDPERLLRSSRVDVEFFEYLQKMISHGYNLIAPNSEYQKRWLIEFTHIDPAKIAVLSNGVEKSKITEKDVRKFKGLFGEDKILSTACRLVPWKGVNYLIKSLNFLPKNVKLVIAGSGPYEKRLKKTTNKLKLTRRVLFLGKIPHEKIQTFIKASDIFVLPSLYEPSALALLDAIAAETPIIATNIGGTPEIINNKVGLLVKPKDPEDIAEKVIKILENRKLRGKIRRNQRRVIKKYLWKNLVKKYIKTYERIL